MVLPNSDDTGTESDEPPGQIQAAKGCNRRAGSDNNPLEHLYRILLRRGSISHSPDCVGIRGFVVRPGLFNMVVADGKYGQGGER